MSRETRAEKGPVRVLIVDDSALIRQLLAEILPETGEIEVAGFAKDGEEAIRQAAKLRPDVITLDVQMPGRSGLEILPELLAAHEAPVVMVSSLTREGADVTLAALELGAVDYMQKPEKFQFTEIRHSGPQLIAKILSAAHSRVRRLKRLPKAELPEATSPARRKPSGTRSGMTPAVGLGPIGTAVVIGISTGGPQTLAAVMPGFEPPLPPILIVQHMPAKFTGVFAERLDRHCNIAVKEAEEGDLLLPNRILIAPGGRHLSLTGSLPRVQVALLDDPPVSGHRPSIDVLFFAAARVYGAGAVGFIMTGMGRDGVEGAKAILAAGGDTYGQNEASSVVYGMNKAAFLEGAARAQFSPDELPTILRLLGRKSS